MKRMMMTMLTAVLIGSSVMAQEEKNEKREPRKFDKTEMVKHRTDETVSRYKLSDKQAKQLLELNTKYADKMGPRGFHRPHHHGRPGAGRPSMPPKDEKGKRPEPPKDGAKMKEHRQQMEKTMKAYDAELKKIMTDEQYKNYQADRKKFHKKEKVAK